MTTIKETRHTEKGTPYDVYTPIYNASDPAYNAWFIEQLREFLHRQGCSVEHLPDEQLLMQTRHTFANTNSRLGRITSANPVQSE